MIGKHKHADGEHYHFVWGQGRSDAETLTKEEIQEAYKARGEEYVPLGVHGTTVAVDWDSCYAVKSMMYALLLRKTDYESLLD